MEDFTFEYEFEEIESIEQLDDFENEDVYDVEVADSSHTFIGNDILVHNSVYTTYGNFFKCMTPKYQEKYNTVRKKAEWILWYNQEFQDKLNTQWCEDIYNPRHGRNVHNFELETISEAGIYLKKKKYLKALIFSKGKWFNEAKMSGTGIEIIKSTTPHFCRGAIKEITKDLMFNSGTMTKDEYWLYLNNMMSDYKKKFLRAPIEEISQTVGVNAYFKYILNDKDELKIGAKCPPGPKAIALYNHLAYKAGRGDLYVVSGKVKYYNIREGKNTSFFGYPSGKLPTFAPKMDKTIQWQKTMLEPINRFLEVMQFPMLTTGQVCEGAPEAMQMSLFSLDEI